ncbi:MAG TPA: peptidase [Aliiroseovarius sp.]|nr:peptidase [Aliiroseovarius sp.]
MGDQVALHARGWIGTPYAHQASVRGAGTDCLGLLRGVWREVLGQEPVRVPAYTRDWSEPGRDEVLWKAARRYLIEKPLGTYVAGDVVLFRMRSGSVAKHLGIIGQGGKAPSFVHAYSGHGVVESPLTPPWARRIVARFAFPELTEIAVQERPDPVSAPGHQRKD